MVMGNCFSPVMEGSQFKWNNIVVNSPGYITPIRRKKFKISFGEFDLSKVLSNVSSNVLESNVTIMDPVDNYFYNYIDIQIRNFNDNPIPDFYVGVVDKVGD